MAQPIEPESMTAKELEEFNRAFERIRLSGPERKSDEGFVLGTGKLISELDE